MIRINLLPHKKVKPMEAGVLKFWMASIVLAILLIGGSGVMWIVMASEISELEDQKVQLGQQLEQLNEDVKKVDEFEASRKNLEQKLVIIGELTKQRVPLTKLLNELNKYTSIDDIWFESLKFKDTSFSVECFGKTEKSVKDYVDALEHSDVLSGVQRTGIKDEPNKLRKGQLIFRTTITGNLSGYEKVGKITQLDSEKGDAKGKKGKKGKKGNKKSPKKKKKKKK